MRLGPEGSEFLELFLELFCHPGVVGVTGEPGPPVKLNNAGNGVAGYVRTDATLSTAYTAQDKDGMGMSRSQLVAEHLPLLRRYARALTGNQASGDAYVAAMLEALLQDSALLDERHGPRAGLF